MDIFGNKYEKYLEGQLIIKDARIKELESRLFEYIDAKVYNKTPERLVREKSDKKPDDRVSTQPSDALSAAEEDAWNRSKPKKQEEANK